MRITEDFERSEINMLAGRLHGYAEDLGIKEWQVAYIVGLPIQIWPADHNPVWVGLDVQQETRLRQLLEVCERVTRIFGDDAAFWFVMCNEAMGTSPLEFLGTDFNALRAMRDALRIEMHGI